MGTFLVFFVLLMIGLVLVLFGQESEARRSLEEVDRSSFPSVVRVGRSQPVARFIHGIRHRKRWRGRCGYGALGHSISQVPPH